MEKAMEGVLYEREVGLRGGDAVDEGLLLLLLVLMRGGEEVDMWEFRSMDAIERRDLLTPEEERRRKVSWPEMREGPGTGGRGAEGGREGGGLGVVGVGGMCVGGLGKEPISRGSRGRFCRGITAGATTNDSSKTGAWT
jgi:hypothetical protein